MRSRALVSITAVLLTFVFGPFASAQQAPDLELSELPDITFEAEVMVTGSLIPREDLTALSPVTVMEVPTELTYSGIVRIEDLVTTMPQAFAGQNSTIANGATGTASISLRHLGPERTLVLINGRRMTYGDWQGADLNAVPPSLVKRIDVLTGGASTVYGSDAMAGVVNFILDTDFTGVRGGLQYSFYNHDNDNAYAQQLNLDAGFEPPTGWVSDGDAVNANIAVGGAFADGKGHAVAYIDYRNIEELTKEARDYMACAVMDTDHGPMCGGSQTTERGTFLTFDAQGFYTGKYTLDWVEDGGDGHSLRPWAGERFNYGPDNHIQRPDENWNTGAFANYEINEHFDVFVEIMTMSNATDAQLAPTGSFWDTISRVNCDNPMLSDQQRDIICTQGGYGPEDYANVLIWRRNTEGGPRRLRFGHQNTRLVAGLRGDITSSWGYELYGLHATSSSQESLANDFSPERVPHTVDVIEDPTTGEWVCRDEQARADGCVPWNVFQQGAVDQAAIDYMSVDTVFVTRAKTEVLNLTLTGDLEPVGVAIPSASEGLQLALGAEVRSEWLDIVPDEVATDCPGTTGGYGCAVAYQGGFNVSELFVEALVPVVQDTRGAKDLSLELGYRWSDYSTSGGFDTYKAMASWAVNDSWRLRGGYNRAVRAPTLTDLYTPVQQFDSGFVDPCEGDNPAASFEQCARTGVTEEQYGSIPDSTLAWPGGISNIRWGGNLALDPEAADTYTAGVVWTPTGITGLSVTLDYYDIEIADAILELWEWTIFDVCMETGHADYCGRIHRDEHGSIWMTPDGYTDVSRQNAGTLESEGIDLNANYLLGLGSSGFLVMDLMGSYLLRYDLSSPEYHFECAGYFGHDCGQPNSRWRHRLRATWESAIRLNLSLAWRYLGSADMDPGSPYDDLTDDEWLEYARLNLIDQVRAYNWFDLAISYTMRNGVKFTLGVNNVLDEEPPLMPGYADSRDIWFNLYGNYDPLGRYIFGSVQFNF
jgi:outer membrane receptor protein involved in Fe transport